MRVFDTADCPLLYVLIAVSSPTCLPGSEKKAASGRRAKGRDAQNAEVTGCSRLSRQGEQCVCVCVMRGQLYLRVY